MTEKKVTPKEERDAYSKQIQGVIAEWKDIYFDDLISFSNYCRMVSKELISSLSVINCELRYLGIERRFRRWGFRRAQIEYRIIRGQLLQLCGYVKLPRKLQDMSLEKLNSEIKIHSGLTFLGTFPRRSDEETGDIWVGFDCAQENDVAPYSGDIEYLEACIAAGYEYRDMDYVQTECRKLVDHLANMAYKFRWKGILPSLGKNEVENEKRT